MKAFRITLSLCTVALLSGCGGSQTGAIPQNVVAQARVHQSGKSWMLPEAKRRNTLVYISDWSTNDVYVYIYNNYFKQVGVLTDFTEPLGQCVDAKGDVWVTNYGGYSVVEYAHGGKSPIATLTTNGSPQGCSIAPKSGNLAVADNYAPSNPDGFVEVFKHASGEPTDYANPNCANLRAPGYDGYGNLYVESAGNAQICELPAGKKSLRPASANFSIQGLGSAMWDGKYITFSGYQDFGGVYGTVIYQAAQNASGALTLVGTTYLQNCNLPTLVVQPFIVGEKNTPVNKTQGTAVVGGATTCLQSSPYFMYWHYPYGGNAAETFYYGVPQEPYGDSVSIPR